jgi:SAM-dependent methyltransferase
MNNALKRNLSQVYNFLKLLGIDPRRFITTLRGFYFYFQDYSEIKKQKGLDTTFKFGRSFPILDERFAESGAMSGAYFHQDLLVARKIFLSNPTRHIDIGSRIDGFVAHVASFREIEVFDIRSQTSKVENVIFKQADLMNLPDDLINCCDSISSLHVIEHFGLGRYNDPINYFGYMNAIDNIYKILKTNGKFYFSVPIGEQRIEFNAHRVFDLSYLIELLTPIYRVDSFSYVNDKGDLFKDVALEENKIKTNFNCNLGCGIFELTKK